MSRRRATTHPPGAPCVVAAVCLVALALSAPVRAQSAAGWTPPERFHIDIFTTDDGLPAHDIWDLDQSPDGRLWIATMGGLASFDGYDFTVYSTQTAGLPSDRVEGLFAAGADSIWFTTESGEVGILARGVARTIMDGLPPVRSVAQDAEGRVWIIQDNGIVHSWKDGERQIHEDLFLDSLSESPTPPDYRHGPRLWQDRDGRIWANRASRAPSGALGILTTGGFLARGDGIGPGLVIDRSRNRALAIVRTADGLTLGDVDGRGSVSYREEPGWWPRLVDSRGRLWVSRGDEIGVIDGETGSRTVVARLPGLFATAMFEDREGNVWVGTSTGGLARIRENPFQTIGTTQGLDDGGIRATLAGPAGSVYALGVGTQRIRDGRAGPVQPAYFNGIDDRGAEWWTSPFVWRGADPPASRIVVLGDRLQPDVQVPDAYLARSAFLLERVWPYGEALRRERLYSAEETIGPLRDAYQTADGTIWISGDRGVAQLRDGRVRHFLPEDGFPTSGARYFHEDSDGELWLGTYGIGLLKIVGDEILPLTIDDGLAENVASAVLEDDAGNLWLAGNLGIHRVSRAALERRLAGDSTKVHTVTYGRTDGLANPETTGGSAARATDGRLWFPTFGGAAVVDPAAAIALDSVAPLIDVLGVSVAGEAITSTEGPAETTVTLTPSQRRFDVRYTAITLRDAPGVRYRYRLEGFDDDWIDAGTSRTATYTNVGPGAYTFRVRAINRAGVESANAAALAIMVQPFFSETPLFKLGVVLLALLATWLAYRVRVEGLKRREAVLQARVLQQTEGLRAEKVRTERAYERLASQAEELRALSDARTRFFTNVSHEFRTPLTLILGPLRELADGRYGSLPAGAAEQVAGALDRGEDLTRLVDRVLEASRLEAGELQLSLREESVSAIVRRVAESFYNQAGRMAISFVVDTGDEEVVARVDGERLEQVVRNLVSNAFKFTPREGRIALTLHLVPGDPGQIEIRVEDSGIGISEADLPYIFDRFYQAKHEGGDGRYGTGIGLALSREYVHLHGGSIEAASRLGEGATFTVRIPVRADAQQGTQTDVARPTTVRSATPHSAPRPPEQTHRTAAPPSPAGPAPSAEVAADDPPTVVIIEDHEDVRSFIRRSLEPDYRVVEAKDGRDGLRVVRRHMPDAVVSDVMMPGLDGMAFVRAIRADDELKYLPVILLTAKAARDAIIEGLEGGADDYVTKPFEPRELRARIGALLDARRRLRERWESSGRGSLPTVEIPLVSRAEPDRRAELVTRMHAVIGAHLDDESFGVDDLASALAMSRATLYRRVAEVVDSSPLEVILEHRLEQAALWLTETDASVSEIAYGVGFKSVPHFSSRFKARFGQAPGAWRASR